MIVLFAGHDTTAHTMTWFTWEMSRHPEYQARVHAEVDALFVAKARILPSHGAQFGDEVAQFQRLNCAVARAVLEEAMRRLRVALDARYA